MVFQFNQYLCKCFDTVKLWYLEHRHTQYHGYIEISVIFFMYFNFRFYILNLWMFWSFLFVHWVWDNITILSLYYTYLKKMWCLISSGVVISEAGQCAGGRGDLCFLWGPQSQRPQVSSECSVQPLRYLYM